jgi:hypothetical protein
MRDNSQEILTVKKAYDVAVNNGNHLAVREAERLELQLKFLEWVSNGFVIEDKFHVGYQRPRWRVLGKNNWYWYSTPEQFVKKYILKEQ